jgi:predicted alpha/beta hydrolase family esterase
MKINATCIGFSGFFMRSPSWDVLKPHFRDFRCIDHLRDNPEMSLQEYCNAAIKEINSTEGPHILIGHSFGGFLALATAAASKSHSIQSIYLLSGLGYKPQTSASDFYQLSLQNSLQGHSVLNTLTGSIDLKSKNEFIRKVSAPNDLIPATCFANHEPLGLVTDIPEWPLILPAGIIHYVIPKNDKFTPIDAQTRIASSLDAQLHYCEGGHGGSLMRVSWLKNIKQC